MESGDVSRLCLPVVFFRAEEPVRRRWMTSVGTVFGDVETPWVGALPVAFSMK